jgi:hypothetical protein
LETSFPGVTQGAPLASYAADADRPCAAAGELVSIGVVTAHLLGEQSPGDEPALAALMRAKRLVAQPGVEVEGERAYR